MGEHYPDEELSDNDFETLVKKLIDTQKHTNILDFVHINRKKKNTSVKLRAFEISSSISEFGRTAGNLLVKEVSDNYKSIIEYFIKKGLLESALLFAFKLYPIDDNIAGQNFINLWTH